MDGFKKNRKAGADEIPAATQLFTPDWIVRYLVQNTVGRLWMQSHPDCQLYRNWDYYIQPTAGDVVQQENMLAVTSPEELAVCDPACGSGHMLTYAFDLLYEIYEEEGYSPSDIPALILEHNLYGMEIDERAANLAAFALTMKARSRSRRFFRKQVTPRIQRITPVEFTDSEVAELNNQYGVNLDSSVWNTYVKADVYGSLIQPPQELVDLAESEHTNATGDGILFDSILRERAQTVLDQTKYLSRKYTAVVANPPYMGAKNMSGDLKQFVQNHYEDGKADLFSAFILRNSQLIQHDALLGMITMQSWMFLSSYETLRRKMLATSFIETMAHLGAGAFDSIGGEVVSTVAFTLRNGSASGKGSYIRLVDVSGDDNQANACAEAVSVSKNYRFEVDQHEFAQIPGSPIVYWLDKNLRRAFMNDTVDSVLFSDGLTKTGDNDHFLRMWWELCHTAVSDRSSYRFCAKGGGERSYYGNLEHVVKWNQETREYYHMDRVARISPEYLWEKEGITWTKISSKGGTFRLLRGGDIAETGGPSLFLKDSEMMSRYCLY